MQARRFMQYGVLGGLVLAGLACAGNSSARTEETAVAKDTTTAQDTSAYRAMSRDTTIRDTSVTAVSDSAKWSQTKSGADARSSRGSPRIRSAPRLTRPNSFTTSRIGWPTACQPIMGVGSYRGLSPS